MDKFLPGVVLRRIDDTREVDGQPLRKLYERVVEESKDGYFEGTVYQAIDTETPGRPYTRPVRQIETVVQTEKAINDELAREGTVTAYEDADIQVDRMEALRATNLRIEGDALLADITISDTFMGNFLLAQPSAIFTVEGEYDGGAIGIMYGKGTNMPSGFKMHHVHAAVEAPVPQVPHYWSESADQVSKMDNAVLNISVFGGIPECAEMNRIPSGLMDAFSNLMDQRAFFLNNGSIFHGKANTYDDESNELEDERLRATAEATFKITSADVANSLVVLDSMAEIGEGEELAKPLDAAGVHAMQRDFANLADEIGGVNGAEMFTSGDLVVFGETLNDFWVFWYDNTSGQDNTNRMWRVAKEALKDAYNDKAMAFETFISMFNHQMRLDYADWRGESRSPHPIIVEVHMPLDARHHTKSKVLPVIKRGVFMVDVAESED